MPLPKALRQIPSIHPPNSWPAAAGLRGETFAYWYLRREGYIVIARNFTIAGIKGELDIVAYDGAVLAFVEVKTRAKAEPGQPTPEDAINLEKRRNLARWPASLDRQCLYRRD